MSVTEPSKSTPSKPKGRRIWRQAGALLFGTLLAFAVLEGGARLLELVWPPLPADPGLGFDPDSRLFISDEQNPELRVTNPEKRAAFHEQRFPALPPSNLIRIAALGGSSVHFLEPQFRILEQRLSQAWARPVDIVNAGGHSYGSHRLIPILDELLGYQPDLVLIYTGHNEFEELEQLELADLETLRLRKTLGSLAIFRLLRDWLITRSTEKLREAHNRRVLQTHNPDPARAWAHPFTQEDVAHRMQAFRRNLEHMLSRCQENGVPVILGTVPSNLVRPYLPKEAWQRYQVPWHRYEQGRWRDGMALGRQILRSTLGRHQASDAENDIIREVARQQGVSLADVEAAVIRQEPNGVPGETLFRDHCHLNETGNQLWRETYEALIRTALPAH